MDGLRTEHMSRGMRVSRNTTYTVRALFSNETLSRASSLLVAGACQTVGDCVRFPV